MIVSRPGRKALYLIVGFLLLTPLPVSGGDLHLDTTILGQVRDNDDLLREVPLNGYLGLSLSQPSWNGFAAETNMRLFRDFARKWDDYDLYQAVLHLKPIDLLQIDFGRQFVNEGFSAEILDAIRFKITPPGYVDITVYTGIPRTVEEGDFNKNDGLLSGISLGLKNVERTNAQIHAAWRKNNIRFNDVRENDDILVGANVSHQFAFTTRPLFYGLAEYNVTGRSLDAATAGVDLYPHKRVALNLEFNFFDVNRNFDRPTILGTFTPGGQLLTGRFASTWTLVPDLLDFVQSYAYQRIEVQEGVRRHGHLLDCAFQISWDDIGLMLEPRYYFSQSFGGRLHGARLSAHEQFTQKLYAEASFDFTTYDKVTNKGDNAYSTVLWSGYEILKGLTLSAGFEYNRNTLFTRDLRGSFRVSYAFDHQI